MTFDWTISVTSLIAIASAIVGGIVAWVTLRIKVTQLETDMRDLVKDVDRYRNEVSTNYAAITGLLKANHDRVEDLIREQGKKLTDFQLEVAKNYAGNTALEKVEARIVAGMADIRQRIDEMAPRQRRAT